MKDLKRGVRVRWIEKQHQHTGTATGPVDRSMKVGVRVDGGGRRSVCANRLRPAIDHILILESRLSWTLRSSRNCGDLYRAFLGGYGVRPLYERIHHRDDIVHFVRRHGPDTRIVHISCHGRRDRQNTYLRLSRDRIYLRRHGEIVTDQPWLKILEGKIVIFSACEVGADRQTMGYLVTRNRLELLFAYSDVVYDGLAFVAEALIYDDLILNDGSRPARIAKKVRNLATFLHRQRYDSVRSDDGLPAVLRGTGPVLQVFSNRHDLRTARSDPSQ